MKNPHLSLTCLATRHTISNNSMVHCHYRTNEQQVSHGRKNCCLPCEQLFKKTLENCANLLAAKNWPLESSFRHYSAIYLSGAVNNQDTGQMSTPQDMLALSLLKPEVCASVSKNSSVVLLSQNVVSLTSVVWLTVPQLPTLRPNLIL
jgi:hypothetical protein